jgi:hypothetical protein
MRRCRAKQKATLFVTHRAATRTLPPSFGFPFCPFHRAGFVFPLALKCRKNKAGNGGREKTMKLEDIKNKTKDAVGYLVQSLESGQSDVLAQYLGAMARFHTYSFGNVMLIARQRAGT